MSITVRPVFEEEADTHRSAARAVLGGETLYFDPQDILVSQADIRSSSLRTIHDPDVGALDEVGIWLTPSATTKWTSWSRDHVGDRIGVFVADGRLWTAPKVATPFSAGFIVVMLGTPDKSASFGCRGAQREP